ncbi:ATP-binding cassette subfamily C protein CydD [Microbacterium endophyticum]|uniref:ATP-binding cassette subfamily C protein CydD n=1 Tax=Microbacterium endophyticum TaxID=1526412 RepID=A0A7W4V1Q9_9MICO|nr:thiol reductant ABC exporter subunit CydD [Microbacterium endophyticum]MBB2975237.1 ATP-binding cassette subfamily C protein CydD [Microbacterium endophyticum]NIK37551.1 ATP-binding cassette subfamily C protein CydD [Microbacterium endophyticum]
MRYSRASRGFFAVTAATVLAQTGIILGFAWLLTKALVGAVEGAPIDELIPYAAGALGLALLRGLLIAASERTSATGAAKASLQLRQALIAAVEKLGPAWLARRNGAALAVTSGHGLEALDAYFGRYLPQLIATAITMPIVTIAILGSDLVAGITVIVTMPLIPIFMILIGLATRGVQKRQFDTLRTLASRFADTVGGLSTLKIFGRAERAASSIDTVTRGYKRETMTVLRVSFLSGFALEFLASISVAIIAVTIGFRLLSGDISLTVGLFILLLAPEAYLPLRQVGVQFHAASEGVAATDEIFSVLDDAAALPAAAAPAAASAAADLPKGRNTPFPPSSASPLRHVATPREGVSAGSHSATPIIEVRGMRVARGDRSLPAVDLAVAAQELVLIEGQSGAGKSSIAAALLGFATFEGELLVEGVAVAAARDELAWAGQRPGLISGTVAVNVALGDSAPDTELVERCLRDASAGDIPTDLELGAGGSGLSGGEAQRVAVARALYRLRSTSARVLLLDEPSSALDSETEAALWAQLRAEANTGAAVILISHRTSSRVIADRIVRLAPLEVPV